MIERGCPLMDGEECKKEDCNWYNMTERCCVIWSILSYQDLILERLKGKNERERA